VSPHDSHPAEELLTLWSLGDMGPEESARIASHIAGCGDCRIETAKIQATLECLRRDGDVAPSEGQLAAARLAARSAFRSSRRTPTWVLWAASAAAAVLIAAVAGSLYGGSGNDGSESDARAVAGQPKAAQPETPPESGHTPTAPTRTAVDQGPEKEVVPPGAKLPKFAPKGTVDQDTEPRPPDNGGPLAPPFGDAPVGGATVDKPDAKPAAEQPKQTDTAKPSTTPGGATVAKKPEPKAAPAATPADGGATVEQGGQPEGAAKRTGVLPTPVIALSSFNTLKNAQIEWPDGRREALGKGGGLPWGTKVHVEATAANPAVLVLDDGGVVTIPGGKATISAALMPQPKPRKVRHNPEAPPKARKVVLLPRDRIVVSPRGARVVYVSIPYGYGKVRVLEVGGLGLMVRGGTEVLLQFNAEGMPIGVAELSGHKDLLFYKDGLEAPVEIERGHSMSLLHPDRPSRPDAVKRAGDDLKRIRLLHAREALQAVLDTAGKSWPKAPALADQLSRLKVETLRLHSSTLRQIIEQAGRQKMSATDGARIIRSVRLLDREGKASLGVLYHFLKLVKQTPSRGELLQRELDEIVGKAVKKPAKKR
jgi:hypothetical protein